MPKYYHPANGKVIIADHVARFFGCQLVQSSRGNLMINHSWLTRKLLDAIGTCMECIPRNAFKDIYTCLQFDNDWDKDNKWCDGDVYTGKT